jgi:hypothetical protein
LDVLKHHIDLIVFVPRVFIFELDFESLRRRRGCQPEDGRSRKAKRLF